jgi:hypothetical protein
MNREAKNTTEERKREEPIPKPNSSKQRGIREPDASAKRGSKVSRTTFLMLCKEKTEETEMNRREESREEDEEEEKKVTVSRECPYRSVWRLVNRRRAEPESICKRSRW